MTFLITCLETHTASPDAMRNAILLMQAILHSSFGRTSFCERGVCILLDALHAHSLDHSLLKHILNTLSVACASNTLLRTFVAHNGIHLLIQCLRDNKDAPVIVSLVLDLARVVMMGRTENARVLSRFARPLLEGIRAQYVQHKSIKSKIALLIVNHA